MSCGIRQVTNDEARQFWLQQQDARIFLHPDVLEPLCERVDWWMADWNGNPVCLWPVCHAFDGSCRPPELSAYVGPLWHDKIIGLKSHRWWGITSGVQQAMLELLVQRYGRLEFELPPASQDVRVLQWFPGVQVECRHTAILARPDGKPSGAEDLLNLFATNRRYDARRAARLDIQAWNDPDPEALFRMYEGLLAGKNQAETARRRRREVLALVAMAGTGHCQLRAFRDAGDDTAMFSLTMRSHKTAHLILIVSDPSPRSQGWQAWNQLTALTEAFGDGCTSFDFGGANSKVGAEEKHRFGGWPAIYFRVRVERL